MAESGSPKLSTKVVEIAGRNWLVAQLLGRRFQVATPEVDLGIDLIAFREVGAAGIRALPLQLKCSSKEEFSLDAKYAGRGIPLVFVWNVFAHPVAYMMTFEEALDVVGERAAPTDSFAKKGYYRRSAVSKVQREKLATFQDRWDWIDQALMHQPVSGT